MQTQKKNIIINKRPIVFAAVFFIAGIFLSALLLNNFIAFIVVLLLGAAASVFFFVIKKRGLALLVAIMLLGQLLLYFSFGATFKQEENYKNALVYGRVKSVSIYDDSYTYIIDDLSIKGEKISRNAVLNSKSKLKEGDEIYFIGDIERFNYNLFDSYLMTNLNNKVNYKASSNNIKVVSSGNLNIFEKLHIKIKTVIIDTIGEKTGGVALSIFMGDTTYLDHSVKNDLKITGLAHIYSVSGLHVAFLASAIFIITKKLKMKMLPSLILAFGVIILYGFLTGFPSTLIRAGVMLFIMYLSKITNKKPDTLSSLSMAAIIILLISPMSLFELGFQMSVTSMLGIICFYNPIRRAIYVGENKAYKYLAATVSMSISANAILIAIFLNTFKTFGIYFIIANLVLLPIITLGFYLLFLFIIIILILPFMSFLLMPIKWIFDIFIILINFIAELPYSYMVINKPLGIYVVMYVGIMLILSRYIMLKPRVKQILITSIMGISLLLFLVT